MISKSAIKYIQTLFQKKFRQKERLFLAEGPKIVSEALRADHIVIEHIYALPSWIEENASFINKVDINEINQQELSRISQLSTPNQVIAVIQQPEIPMPFIQKGGFALALDDIRDPGNLGTIIRSADWFGIQEIICSHTCADVYNSKVIQATMGSIFHTRVSYADIKEWLPAQKVPIYGAVLNGKPLHEVFPVKEGIILIGNESHGIHPDLLPLVNVGVTIPRKGHAESLNAAIAASIIMAYLN